MIAGAHPGRNLGNPPQLNPGVRERPGRKAVIALNLPSRLLRPAIATLALLGCHRAATGPSAPAPVTWERPPLSIDSLTAGQRIRVWVGPEEKPRWQLGEFQTWRGDSLRFVRTDLLAARGPAVVVRDSLVRLEAFQRSRTSAVGGGCLAFGGFAGLFILVPTVIAHIDGQPEAEVGYVLAALGAVAGCVVGMSVGLVESSGREWRAVALPAAAPR